jgi:hypothetical protein
MTKIEDFEIPPAFPKMGTWLDYQLEDMWSPGQDIFDFALTEVDINEKRQIRTFLRKALDAPLTRFQLQQLWNAGDTNVMIPNEVEFRSFIQAIIDRIDKQIGPE